MAGDGGEGDAYRVILMETQKMWRRETQVRSRNVRMVGFEESWNSVDTEATAAIGRTDYGNH